MSQTAKRLGLAAVALMLYFVLLMAVWASRPLHDSVPVGVDWTPTTAAPPKPEQVTDQVVRCNTLFASQARAEGLPTLRPQPKGRPALAYQHDPCKLVHSQARLLFVIQSGALIGSTALLVFLAMRSRQSRLALADSVPAGRSI